MNTVDCIEHALRIAERRGYRIRREWLGGAGGGCCEFGGQRWLFLDLAQGAAEHLEQILEALGQDGSRASPANSKSRQAA